MTGQRLTKVATSARILVFVPVQSCARRGDGSSTRMGWRTKTKTSTSISTRKRARRSHADGKSSFGVASHEVEGRVPASAPLTCLRLRGRGGERGWRAVLRSCSSCSSARPVRRRSSSRTAQFDPYPRSQYQHQRYPYCQGGRSSTRSLHPRSSKATSECMGVVSKPTRRARTAAPHIYEVGDGGYTIAGDDEFDGDGIVRSTAYVQAPLHLKMPLYVWCHGCNNIINPIRSLFGP